MSRHLRRGGAGLALLALLASLVACSSGGTVPDHQRSANAALEDLMPMLRRLAHRLAPKAELRDLGTTTHDCKTGGLIFKSWQISFEVPSGDGAGRLDEARKLFAAAGYSKGHENLDYALGPDILWLDEGSDTQLHAVGYRDSPRMDLIVDGPCGPPGGDDTLTGNPLDTGTSG